jgi:hypothetical protein
LQVISRMSIISAIILQILFQRKWFLFRACVHFYLRYLTGPCALQHKTYQAVFLLVLIIASLQDIIKIF